jgi:uncharacterized FlaG/YvyC family protein
MNEENIKASDHLESAKEDLKNAAKSVAETAKYKLDEVVGNVAASVSEAADKVAHKVEADEPTVK